MLTITPHDSLNVLRGDLIKGGAKTPALLRYLPTLGAQHVAYVGTVYGSGAWAVAEAASQLGLDCTLFLAKSDYTPRWLEEISLTGVTLRWCAPEPVASLHDKVSHDYPKMTNLPLGFDTPEFVAIFAEVLREAIGEAPPEIWVPCLSGVLARAACLAYPDVPVHAVSAAKHPGDCGRSILHFASEKFHRPATTPPPYPACPFSDAKLWQFAEKTAVSGAFIVNVSY